jgi:hypothetical protein
VLIKVKTCHFSAQNLGPAGAEHLLVGDVVQVNSGRHVGLKVNEVLNSNLSVALLALEKGGKESLHLTDALLARSNLGVDGEVTGVNHVSNADLAVNSKFIAKLQSKSKALALKLSTDTSDKLVVGNDTVSVFIEILEEAFKLGGAELKTFLTEDPLDLVAVKNSVSVFIDFGEESREGAYSSVAFASEVLLDFVKNLGWGFAGKTEDGVDVGVVAGAADSEPAAEFLIIDSSRVVFVNLIEKSNNFVLGENASNSLEGLAELLNLNSSVTVKIKVLEDALGSLAFIVSPVGALTNLLENDVLKLSNAAGVHILDVLGKTPSLDNDIAEIGLTFGGKHH